MPVHRGKDKNGTYYQWGDNKKYYFNNERDRKIAKYRAHIQGYAIEKSEQRRGKR